MPELPEVETIVRTLSPQVLGKRIAAVTVLHGKSLQHGRERLSDLAGARFVRLFRRAKLVMAELLLPDGKTTVFLAFHLKMTGRFFVHPPGTEPLKHTRIIFDLEAEDAADSPSSAGTRKKRRTEKAPATGSGGRLFFDDMRTFGYCRLMDPEEVTDWPFWKSLGPEPLDTTDKELALRFAGRKAAIKAVLLDQGVVAGVGNIYADESLFRAGILPTARASSLSQDRLEALAGHLKDVLRQSIEECGSSIRDYRDAQGNAGAFQNNFAVYGRKGETCRRCGAPLESTRVAGRGTVYCPKCQTG
jgi:formamidopyrimidine-DNA glycosylase